MLLPPAAARQIRSAPMARRSRAWTATQKKGPALAGPVHCFVALSRLPSFSCGGSTAREPTHPWARCHTCWVRQDTSPRCRYRASQPGLLQTARAWAGTGRRRRPVVGKEILGVVEQGLHALRHAGAVRLVQHRCDVLVREVVVAVRGVRHARVERVEPGDAAIEERRARVEPGRPAAGLFFQYPSP